MSKILRITLWLLALGVVGPAQDVYRGKRTQADEVYDQWEKAHDDFEKEFISKMDALIAKPDSPQAKKAFCDAAYQDRLKGLKDLLDKQLREQRMYFRLNIKEAEAQKSAKEAVLANAQDRDAQLDTDIKSVTDRLILLAHQREELDRSLHAAGSAEPPQVLANLKAGLSDLDRAIEMQNAIKGKLLDTRATLNEMRALLDSARSKQAALATRLDGSIGVVDAEGKYWTAFYGWRSTQIETLCPGPPIQGPRTKAAGVKK